MQESARTREELKAAIAGGTVGLAGVIAVCAAIVLVNVVYGTR